MLLFFTSKVNRRKTRLEEVRWEEGCYRNLVLLFCYVCPCNYWRKILGKSKWRLNCSLSFKLRISHLSACSFWFELWIVFLISSMDWQFKFEWEGRMINKIIKDSREERELSGMEGFFTVLRNSIAYSLSSAV